MLSFCDATEQFVHLFFQAQGRPVIFSNSAEGQETVGRPKPSPALTTLFLVLVGRYYRDDGT